MQPDHTAPELTPEEQSKDAFFRELARLAEEMVDKHGRDFSMGALVLAARWIAEKRPAEPGGAPANGSGHVGFA